MSKKQHSSSVKKKQQPKAAAKKKNGKVTIFTKIRDKFFCDKDTTITTVFVLILAVALLVLAFFLARVYLRSGENPDISDIDPKDREQTDVKDNYKDEVEPDHKLHLLHDAVFADKDLEKTLLDGYKTEIEGGPYVIFLSVCNGQERCMVVSGKGTTLQGAWSSAEKELRDYVKKKKYDTYWLKADVVKATESITTTTLSDRVSHFYDEMYRCGIALDPAFDQAFLEAEINGNKLIDYDTDKLDLQSINKYLKSFDRPEVDKLPNKVVLFKCYGWFCDEEYSVYRLYSDTYNYGRRVVEDVNDEVALGVISTSAQYLTSMLGKDGKFIYGYYPTYDKELTDYNILRHAGTIWSLICQYKLTKDETVIPKIKSAFNYMLREEKDGGFLVWKDEKTAYIVEKKSSEIKLGGNAVAVISMTEYMDEFGVDEEYKKIAVALGEGILTMQNKKTGDYTHVLNSKNYSVKADYRTVYYDGEATFALSRLYSLTKDKKYLEAAERAVDMFIDKSYIQYRDHWVAYALNELTMYETDHDKLEKYYTFALRNAQDNLDIIYNQKTSYHTYMELLMATFEVYDRIKTTGFELDYLKNFNEKKFFDTICHRADYMLNGYCYPEYVMYLKNPARILGGFFVRHDGYRIRIDDVQHFTGGYYKYYIHYDKLMEYMGKK